MARGKVKKEEMMACQGIAATHGILESLYAVSTHSLTVKVCSTIRLDCCAVESQTWANNNNDFGRDHLSL